MADKYRVLNLIRKVDMVNAPVKKWAVVKLLRWQPEAHHIRFEGKCHCKGKYLMSYQLHDVTSRHPGEEDCGYYCPSCGFGNAGARQVWTRKLGRPR